MLLTKFGCPSGSGKNIFKRRRYYPLDKVVAINLNTIVNPHPKIVPSPVDLETGDEM